MKITVNDHAAFDNEPIDFDLTRITPDGPLGHLLAENRTCDSCDSTFAPNDFVLTNDEISFSISHLACAIDY